MSKINDLETYKHLPACNSCKNYHETISYTGLLRRRRAVTQNCGIARPLLVVSGVAYNTDAREMRLTGPCGVEGKFYKHWSRR